MTEAQKLAILQLRNDRVPLRDIADQLSINYQHVIRFLNAIDHDNRGRFGMGCNSKVTKDTPGELDFSHYEATEEAKRAGLLWGERMAFARWDTKRREGQG